MADYLKIFNVNTDAFAVNKGFYFQNLIVLKKWIQSYIASDKKHIFIEVDDDVKEVGETLQFTQVKCFSRNFSFQSDEIKKSIFNFYLLFLANKYEGGVRFWFYTNSGLIESENLLRAWIHDSTLINPKIFYACKKKVSKILIDELNRRKQKKNIKGQFPSETVQSATNELRKKIKENVGEFIKCISWEFQDKGQDHSIEDIIEEIMDLLAKPEFHDKPIFLLKNAFLCEIYKRSQHSDKSQRLLSNESMQALLHKTDVELEAHIDIKFIKLLDEFQEFRSTIEDMAQIQREILHGQISDRERISNLEKKTIVDISEIPHKLTSLPFSFSKVYGRQDCIVEMAGILQECPILCISGIRGIGKTSLVLQYLNEYGHTYSHIAWINSGTMTNEFLALNDELFQNLGLNFTEKDSNIRRQSLIIDRLSNTRGNNLLVLDNFNDDLAIIGTILSLKNWKIVITSKLKLEELSTYKLPKLDYKDAKDIFNASLQKHVVLEDSLIRDFFNFVDYNPLAIKLCAKTISNSIDIDLAAIMAHASNRTLDNIELEVNLKIEGSKGNVQMFRYLQDTFELSNLEPFDRFLLNFLALLPSEDILLNELAEIGGKEFYTVNKTYFSNSANTLHQNGWIERYDDKIRISPLIQEMILYKMKAQNSPYFELYFMFAWLFHRIDEVTLYNPDRSYKYLKYAESILNSIKYSERDSIEQPLILLEFSLINAYMVFDKSDKIFLRLVNLKERAELYLDHNDVNLALINNNLGQLYIEKKDFENGIQLLKDAINILRERKDAIAHLKNIINNLISIYIFRWDVANAMQIMQYGIQIYQDYPQENDFHMGTFQFLIGVIYENAKDYNEAEKCYKLAIIYHTSLPNEKRNDLVLANYLYSFAILELRRNNHIQALNCLGKARNILESRNIKDSSFSINIEKTIEHIKNFNNK